MDENFSKYAVEFRNFVARNHQYFKTPEYKEQYADYIFSLHNYFKTNTTITYPIFYNDEIIKKYHEKIVFFLQIVKNEGLMFNAVLQVSRNLHVILDFSFDRASGLIVGAPSINATSGKLIVDFVEENKDFEVKRKETFVGFK